MNEEILELIRTYRRMNSYGIKNMLRGKYPNLTSIEVTRRMMRLERNNLVTRERDITSGEMYTWVLV